MEECRAAVCMASLVGSGIKASFSLVMMSVGVSLARRTEVRSGRRAMPREAAAIASGRWREIMASKVCANSGAVWHRLSLKQGAEAPMGYTTGEPTQARAPQPLFSTTAVIQVLAPM